MTKYILNKNFSVIQCKNECLIHTIDSVQDGETKKDTTLYLNKSAYFILNLVLEGKDIDEIEKSIKENFSEINSDEQELKESINKTISELEKIGVIIQNGN